MNSRSFACAVLTAADHSDRDPAAWDFAVSDDGVNWTIVEDYDEPEPSEYVYRLKDTANPTGRFAYGTYNRGDRLPFWHGCTAADGVAYAADAEVVVGAGASLVLPGQTTVTGRLKVDAAQGADGTLTFFNPAAGGTLDVVNFTRGTSSMTLPFAVTESANLGNLESWRVNLNGQPTRYGLSLDNGRLSLVKPGFMLLLR